MNKKDIAFIRKQFKVDNELLTIKDIFNVYVKKETGDIYHSINTPFNMLDAEQQDFFMANFKKVLTGQLDAKLFELKFTHGVQDGTQTILYDGLNAESSEVWNDEMLKMVQKMFAEASYTFDTVVTFIKAEFRKPKKNRVKEADEGENDEVYANQFILCSVNKTEQPKKALLFDYNELEYKSNNVLDPIINLTSPLTGFMFPVFNNNSADVNHILYSAGKTNQPDMRFIEDVLDCEEIITAEEDKECFERILRKVIGDKVEPKIISNVYEEIHKIVTERQEEEEDDSVVPMLDVQDVERILNVSGVDGLEEGKVEHAFKDVVHNENYELKASSLLPNYKSKSIKINTKVANVAVSPHDLKNLKQITHNGKRCLVIEIDEDAFVEGFRMDTETL